MKIAGPLAAVCLAGFLGSANCAELAVSREAAAGDGKFSSIKDAIARAQPGDVISLEPDSVFREQAFFLNVKGKEGAPIILDGRGATIDGSVPLVPSEWDNLGGGLFKSGVVPTKYCRKADPAFIARFFFVWDGRINRMGRSLKGHQTPYKEPSALLPGEWTYAETEKAFFIKIPDGATIESQDIRLPGIVSGVQITGDCSHITVRNLTVTRVLNDGFALTTGEDKTAVVRAVSFEKIRAIECGDDGLSAHGDCEVSVDGFLSRGNSTGYCSQGRSFNRRVTIEEIDGVEIYPIGGTHEFVDSTISGHALRPITVQPAPPFASTELVLKDVAVSAAPSAKPGEALVRVQQGGTLRAENITTWGLSFFVAAGGSAEVRNSILAGGTDLNIAASGKWSGSGNVLDFRRFVAAGTSFGPGEFSVRAPEIGEENSSVLAPVTSPPAEWLRGLPPGKGASPNISSLIF